MKAQGLDSSSLIELIDFRERLERVIRERFEHGLALLHTDVVGSTQRFDQYGDVTGKGMQQRHLALLGRALQAYHGTLFNTAGDGAFAYFEMAENAVRAAIRTQQLIAVDNESSAASVELGVRAGVHFGPTLVDGTDLAGHSVNLAARVADIAGAGQISISRDVFSALGSELRARCAAFSEHTVKGVLQPVEVSFLEWRELSVVPNRVFIAEMNTEIPLALDADIISVGRQRKRDDKAGNDIVIRLPDNTQTSRISRFQIEVHRGANALRVRSVTDQRVVVDGLELARNEEVEIQIGACVQLSGVATLHFLGEADDASNISLTDGATVMLTPPVKD